LAKKIVQAADRSTIPQDTPTKKKNTKTLIYAILEVGKTARKEKK